MRLKFPLLLKCLSIGLIFVYMDAVAGNAPKALQVLESQLKQVGLQVCYKKLVDLSRFLMGDNDVNFVLQPIGAINNGSITLSIGHGGPSGNGLSSWTIYASSAVCSGTYEQINHWNKSCQEVKQIFFGGFGSPRPLLGGVSQSEMTPTTHVYFVQDADALGCTSIKKELLP